MRFPGSGSCTWAIRPGFRTGPSRGRPSRGIPSRSPTTSSRATTSRCWWWRATRPRRWPCPFSGRSTRSPWWGWWTRACGAPPVARPVIAEYLAPYRSDPPDALILGCTHYPVLKNPIREFLGENTVLIDSGEEAARVVDILLSGGGGERGGGGAGVCFLVRDDP